MITAVTSRNLNLQQIRLRSTNLTRQISDINYLNQLCVLLRHQSVRIRPRRPRNAIRCNVNIHEGKINPEIRYPTFHRNLLSNGLRNFLWIKYDLRLLTSGVQNSVSDERYHIE